MSKFKKGQLVTLKVEGDHPDTDKYNIHNYPCSIHKGDSFYVLGVEYDQVLIAPMEAIERFGFEGAKWWVYMGAVSRIRKKIV